MTVLGPRSRSTMFRLLLLLLLPFAFCAPSVVSGEFDCEAHESTFQLSNPRPDANCLSLLRDPAYLDRFDRCKNETCYLFLQEPPFVILPRDMLNSSSPGKLVEYQRLFDCGQPGQLHDSLGGIAFELHARTSSRDSPCVWAGPSESCTFNAVVDFTRIMAEQDPPYKFAVTGLLLETPQRQCEHEPSAPFIDNSMIIIGRNTDDNPAAKGPFYSLVKPFRGATWGIFGAVVFLFMLVCFAIAVRFHVLRGRSLVTAFFIFAGERDQAMAYEHDTKKHAHLHLRGPRSRGVRRRSSAAASVVTNERDAYKRSMTFATKYGLSMTLFRISLLSFIAVFALFYEVAVVNFLFQQQALEIDKRVKSLSVSELESYSVLKNSALENVWHATVNPKGLKYDPTDQSQIPWQRCTSATECILWVADEDHPVNFDVTFEVLGKYLIRQEADCNHLTVFQTKDILYQFNAGWLYNSAVDASFRKNIDRELVALRINGTIRSIIDEIVGDFSCTKSPQPDIGPLIIIVPLSLFVLPPLVGSILVILCWRSAPEAEEEEQNQVNAADPMLQSGVSKNSLLDSTSEDITSVDPILDKASNARIDSAISESQSTLVEGNVGDSTIGEVPDEENGLPDEKNGLSDV